MPRNQGTSRKGKPGKLEKAAGMGRSLLIKNKYRPRYDGKNIYGGMNGMAAIPGMTSIGITSESDLIPDMAENHTNKKLLSSNTGTHPRSILDMDDLDDFLLQANLAEREFFSDRGGGYGGGGYGEPIQIIDPHRKTVQWADTTPNTSTSTTTTTTTTVMELSVPRRPPWTSDMSRDELEQQEKLAFLEWRRKIAQYEAVLSLSSSSSVVSSSTHHHIPTTTTTTTTTTTPFEKNIHVWKQLWRVIERSNVVIQIIDARNPLFYLSYDLYQYVTMELHKPMILLFNKSDYLSKQQRKIWKQYFTSDDNNNNHDDGNDENQTDHSSKIASSDPHYHPHRHNWTQNCHIIFFSAMREQKKLDQLAAMERKRIQLELLTQQEEDNDNNNNASIFGNRNDYDDDNSSDEEDDDDDDEHDHDRETNNPEDENEPDDDNDDDITKALEDPNPDEDEDDIHDTDEKDEEDDEDNDDDDDDDVRILTRAELIETMRTFAKEHHCQAEERYDYRIQYGMVGFPNVGKSSVINVLAGASKHTHNTVRVAVASQPGKTKHFQTVLLQDQQDIMLCDCPGLVFPSFVSSTADLIAAGVYPIAQMRDHWPVTHLVCQRIPRNILNAHYGITLPVLSHQQLQDRGYDPARNNNTNDDDDDDELPPPTAEELLTTYCIARGLLASFSGVPDFQRAARIIIKDYADGKLLYCHPPPNMTTTELKEFYSHTVQTALRNTQRTRERLLKQQQKLQVQQSTVDEGTTSRNKKNNQNHTTKQHGTTKQMTALDAFDDELIQMIAATTLPTSSTTATNNHDPTHRKSNRRMISSDANTSNSHKLHYKKSAGAKWGKKDRKNRNKDPYGCHTATPDNTVLSMI